MVIHVRRADCNLLVSLFLSPLTCPCHTVLSSFWWQMRWQKEWPLWTLAKGQLTWGCVGLGLLGRIYMVVSRFSCKSHVASCHHQEKASRNTLLACAAGSVRGHRGAPEWVCPRVPGPSSAWGIGQCDSCKARSWWVGAPPVVRSGSRGFSSHHRLLRMKALFCQDYIQSCKVIQS